MQRRITHHLIKNPLREVSLLIQKPAIKQSKDSVEGAVVGLGGGDEGGRGVDADDGGDVRQVVGSEFGVAAAEVEDVVGGLRGEVLQDFGGEARDEGGGGGVGGAGPVVGRLGGGGGHG